ncbi:MAG TPA: hypothetical protein VLH85_02860 [Levilinea sp.]|nr:hypothetical protein [Levilinea sp.]
MGQSLVNRKTIVVFISVAVGLLHFLTGPGYGGPWPVFVNGYMIDILLPCAMYLVLGIIEGPFQLNGAARGALVFAAGAVSETLQFFNVPIFGQTFDPLDYLMFAAGILLGIVFERFVLSRIPAKRSPRTSIGSR